MNRWITVHVFMDKVTFLGLKSKLCDMDKYLHKVLKTIHQKQ